jgi:hypothetical protein
MKYTPDFELFFDNADVPNTHFYIRGARAFNPEEPCIAGRGFVVMNGETGEPCSEHATREEAEGRIRQHLHNAIKKIAWMAWRTGREKLNEETSHLRLQRV